MSERLLFGSYVRVSSQQQQNDDTEQYQHKYNEAMVKRVDGILVDTYFDPAVSGYKRAAHQRKELMRMLEAIREGEINAVVFFEESRLTRQIIDFYTDVLAPALKLNPEIVFYKSSTGELWDPFSVAAKQSLIQAYADSENKSRLATQVQNSIFNDEKRRPGAALPFGILEVSEDKLRVNDLFPVVLFIFELASWGYSERHISRILNAIRPGNRDYAHTEIHYILYNPLYIGMISLHRRKSRDNGTLRPMGEFPMYQKYPPLVPRDLWDLAHFELQKKSTNKSYRTQTSFLLSGVVSCSRCHEHLKSKNSLKKDVKGNMKLRNKHGELLRYYFCPQCGRRFNPEELDPEILKLLRHELGRYVTTTGVIQKIQAWSRYLSRLQRDLDAEIEHHEFQIQQFQGTYYQRQFSKDTLDELYVLTKEHVSELREAKTTVLNLGAQLEMLSDPHNIQRMVDRVKAINEFVPPQELRYFVLNMVESCEVVISRGHLIIEELTFRTLPMPYFSEQVHEIERLVRGLPS
ncbi:recombinase family protein [Alicyclobacillus mengziensis]|uniref:Recombinase family protein n=1 Tax=Alicyclobacillus mengziensis TaxID=2931921 RepID=A0A9X7VXZ5_9BACL|nr:recombinase family protein [Alicyclobacillus mengziensis]QSO46754.1 recombinase family protein [Alicyclobacillus mengziensis]